MPQCILRHPYTLSISGAHLGDYRVRVIDGEFELWSDSGESSTAASLNLLMLQALSYYFSLISSLVPRIELESHKVTATDVVIPTADTLRHTDLVSSWLVSRKPCVLCGPPGVGKSMSLVSALQSSQNIVLASLNFSSRTTPEIILKTFNQYCQTVSFQFNLY
jgi:dynein heavy chain 1